MSKRYFSFALAAMLTLSGFFVGTSALAVTFGSVTSNANSTNGATTLIIDKPSSVVAGDFLIAGIVWNSGSDKTITSPSGWTLIERTDKSDDVGMATYRKVAGSSEPSSYSWGISSSGRAAGGIIRYTGVDTSNPIASSDENEGSDDDAEAPSLTTTQENQTVIFFYGIDDDESLSTPSQTTSRFNVDNSNNTGPRILATDFVKTTIGATGVKTSDIGGGNEDWIAQTIILKNAITTGSLTFTKNTIGGDGTFSMSGTGGIGNFDATTVNGTFSQTFTGLSAGSYTITETVPMGWDKTADTCSSVTVSIGETPATCSIQNTKRGSITVVKNVINPDNEEVSDSQVFTVYLGEASGQNISEGNNVIFSNLIAGTYTITEDENANYEFISFSQDNDSETSGAQITISAGQDVTLTLTNKQKKGTLMVNKTVVHPNNRTETAGEFSFTLNEEEQVYQFVENEENSLLGSLEIEINPGTYTVNEILDVENPPFAISSTCMNMVIESNGSAICTITNSDIPSGFGAVTVFKNLPNDDGGTFIVDNFPLWTTEIGIEEEEYTPTEMFHGQSQFFEPGSYVISESNPGELEGFTQSISCNNGETTTLDGNITLAEQEAWTCTITNDDKPAYLKIVKNTNNASYNGTFEFNISGTETEVSITTVNGTGQTEWIEVNKGSYDITEVISPEWNFSSSSCEYDNESTGTEIENGENITVNNGDYVTCTFSNVRKTGDINIIKNIVGSEEFIPADFQVHVKQNGIDANGSPQAGQSGEGVTFGPLPTGEYTISETGNLLNFVTSFSGDCNENGVLAVTENTVSTCTITNTYSETPSFTLAYSAETNGSLVGTASQTVAEGTNGSAVEAIADTGFHFVSWSDGVTANPRIDANVHANITVTANFAEGNSSSNNGGSGVVEGGGSTFLAVQTPLSILDESVQILNIGQDQVTITWITPNHVSSSQVIYSAEGEAHTLDLNDNTGNTPKFGYAHSTENFDTNPTVTSHSVTITGLTPGVTYYFRAVSHGSLAISEEVSTSTTSNSVAISQTNPPSTSGSPTVTPTSPSPSTSQNNPPTAPTPTFTESIPQSSTDVTGLTPKPETTETKPTETNTNLPPQPAALTSAIGGSGFFAWISENIIWLLILLFILGLGYWYFSATQKAEKKS